MKSLNELYSEKRNLLKKLLIAGVMERMDLIHEINIVKSQILKVVEK